MFIENITWWVTVAFSVFLVIMIIIFVSNILKKKNSMKRDLSRVLVTAVLVFCLMGTDYFLMKLRIHNDGAKASAEAMEILVNGTDK